MRICSMCIPPLLTVSSVGRDRQFNRDIQQTWNRRTNPSENFLIDNLVNMHKNMVDVIL